MKITCISDTHNKHQQIPLKYLSGGDVIIHAGDISGRGWVGEVQGFLDWYSKLPYTHKILIAGNHDFFFEKNSQREIDEILANYPTITYLKDSGIVIDGVKIWGSPWQPWFYNWAFNCRGEEIKQYWDMIPLDTDILITHGPIRGYLDMTLEGDLTGCPYLLEYINKMPNLKYHICGHIHEAYGRYLSNNGVEYINASVLGRDYIMKNAPIELILDKHD